jgi:hypothetical protein
MAVNCTVGTAWPVVTVTTGASGARVRAPVGCDPSPGMSCPPSLSPLSTLAVPSVEPPSVRPPWKELLPFELPQSSRAAANAHESSVSSTTVRVFFTGRIIRYSWMSARSGI